MGCTFGIVNRGLIGTWTVATGTAVTGYPTTNLNDASAQTQAQITPSTSTVLLKINLGAAPSSTSNTDWAVNSFGLVNHNLDGATVEVNYNSSDSDPGTGNNVVLAATALDANMGNPNLLVTFASKMYRYYWVRITSAPNPTKIGVVHLGYAVDMGDPEVGAPVSYSPPPNAGQTGTGYSIITRFNDPLIGKQFVFRDPSVLLDSVVSSKAVASSTTFPTYATLKRMLGKAKQVPINATTVTTGLSAGAGIPMVYHEGSARGLSGAGRPAYYGLSNFQITADTERATASVVSVSILDMNDANNVEIDPPTN